MINEIKSTINENTIYVLPCLQELKTFGTQLGYEKEQQIFKDNDTSDLFDAYWSGNNKVPDNNMTKNGFLTIPNCSEFGFNLKNIDYLNSRNYKKITTLGAKIPECGDFSCSKKWAIYSKFLNKKCVETQGNVALLVTHHNRMRDSTQGLLPFKKSFFTKNKYNAYANNFCLKISIINGENPTYSLFFEGFPDKGIIEKCGDNVIAVDTSDAVKYHAVEAEENNDDDDDNNDDDDDDGGDDDDDDNYNKIGGTVQYRGGKKKYKYFCNTNIEEYINTELITQGITDAKIDKNLDIYVIRHGNSLHNKPVSAKEQDDRLDSSLTPLGMYQANELGGYFNSQGVFNNANIILCSSFLQRAQLTGLLLLYYAGIKLDPTMSNGMIEMLDNAIIRYSSQVGKYRFDPNKFLGYSPLGEIIKDDKDKNSKIYQPFEGTNKEFQEYLSELNDLLAGRESAQKAIKNLIKKLKDNLVKNSVSLTSDGWNLIPGGDDDDDDDAPQDDSDDPRLIPNQGGKKRRQTKKHRVMKSKKVRRMKKHNKKSKKVKRRSNKRKA
jgi:hypothetical protein